MPPANCRGPIGRDGSFPALDRPEMFQRLASHCLNPGKVVPGATEPPTAFTDPAGNYVTRDNDANSHMEYANVPILGPRRADGN